jgi:hypothetical protein
MARNKQVSKKAAARVAAAAKAKAVGKVAAVRKTPTMRNGKLISQKETGS